jgi:hypothetical protein
MMVAAMMFPAQMRSLRCVVARSLRKRQHWNIILVLIGYCVPWLAAGLTTELILDLSLFPHYAALPSVAFVVAAVWQLMPLKRRALIRCHPEPLMAPTGRKGDWDCLKFGMLLAGRCGVSCWALMVACTASRHALWALVLTSLVVWTERKRPEINLVWLAGVLALGALATSF